MPPQLQGRFVVNMTIIIKNNTNMIIKQKEVYRPYISVLGKKSNRTIAISSNGKTQAIKPAATESQGMRNNWI